jgi:hypothetical protein
MFNEFCGAGGELSAKDPVSMIMELAMINVDPNGLLLLGLVYLIIFLIGAIFLCVLPWLLGCLVGSLFSAGLLKWRVRERIVVLILLLELVLSLIWIALLWKSGIVIDAPSGMLSDKVYRLPIPSMVVGFGFSAICTFFLARMPVVHSSADEPKLASP